MNFVLQEQKYNFRDTPVENIFIDDYMLVADGTYVKVYLLGYRYARDPEGSSRFNSETIARNLSITVEEVLDAWDYWEKEGIVVKHPGDEDGAYGIEFVNLKQYYADNIYKERIIAEAKNSDDDSKKTISAASDNEIKSMFESVEEIMGRPLTITEKKRIISWLNSYGTSPEMMVQAFSYCVNNKKKKSLRSVENVITSWHDANVTDIDTMAEYLEKKNDRYSVYSRISKSLGFSNRILTEAETKAIDKWVDEWGFSMEMIMKCLENSTKMTSPNLNYFDSILNRWYDKGFKTVDDLKNDKKPDEKKKAKPDKETANKFHNFDQKLKDYSESELEEIGRKNLKKKLKQLGIDLPEGDDTI